MNVLVATRNKDKFSIVKTLIESIVPDIQLEALNSTALKGDVIEVGTIEQRATKKTEYFLDKLDLSIETTTYEAVLGIAVGKASVSPHSQELTDQILEDIWPIKTPLLIWRAYALARFGKVTRVEITTVPFEYKGNQNNISREVGRYPLSYVIGPIGVDRCVSEQSEAETNIHNLKHSKDSVSRLFAY